MTETTTEPTPCKCSAEQLAARYVNNASENECTPSSVFTATRMVAKMLDELVETLPHPWDVRECRNARARIWAAVSDLRQIVERGKHDERELASVATNAEGEASNGN